MFFIPANAHELEAQRLEGEIAEVCGLLNATNARLVRLIRDVLSTGAWTGWGVRSPEHWVAWQCGVSAGHARKLVAAARRLNDLPVAEAASDAGELSEDQVGVIVRHAPTHNDAEITELARYATVGQLQRVLRSYPFVPPTEPDADPAEAAPVEERREVNFAHTDDGRWRLNADLPGDEGALFERSLIAERERLFRETEDGQEVTWADALMSLADRGVAPNAAGRHHRDRTMVLVHLDTRPGEDENGQPCAHFHGGPAVPDTLRRYLSCDSRIRPVWETDGVAVSVGRAMRIVPDRTRIVIEERDRGCRAPGCHRSRWLHVHHIVHWEDGGVTDTANLVCLCQFHHRAHHRRLLGITGNPDSPGRLVFTDQRGRPLNPNAPPTPPGDPPHQAVKRLGIKPGTYHHPTGERLDPWSIDFSRPPDPRPPPGPLPV